MEGWPSKRWRSADGRLETGVRRINEERSKEEKKKDEVREGGAKTEKCALDDLFFTSFFFLPRIVSLHTALRKRTRWHLSLHSFSVVVASAVCVFFFFLELYNPCM